MGGGISQCKCCCNKILLMWLHALNIILIRHHDWHWHGLLCAVLYRGGGGALGLLVVGRSRGKTPLRGSTPPEIGVQAGGVWIGTQRLTWSRLTLTAQWPQFCPSPIALLTIYNTYL